MTVPYLYSTTSEESADAMYDWRSDTVRTERPVRGGERAVSVVARVPPQADGDTIGDDELEPDEVAAEDDEAVDPLLVLEGDESWDFATDGNDGDEQEDANFAADDGAGIGVADEDDENAAALAEGWGEDEDEGEDEGEGEGDWDGLAGLDLPEFDGGARQPLEVQDGDRLTVAQWRHSWVEGFLLARGAVSRENRRLIERVVADSMNPAATLKCVAILLGEDDRWDEVRACFELRVAWSEHGELGTAWPFREYGSVSMQVLDIPLSWRAALRILRAFPALPTTDEAVMILEALHRSWERSRRALGRRFLAYGQMDYDGAPRFFVDYAVEMLEQHGDPFYWAEPA